MSLASQFSLPPIHEPIIDLSSGKERISQGWIKWFNELYDTLSQVFVEGRDPTSLANGGETRIKFLQLPVMTTATRDLVTTPVNGTIIYNSTIPAVQAYVGGAWTNL